MAISSNDANELKSNVEFRSILQLLKQPKMLPEEELMCKELLQQAPINEKGETVLQHVILTQQCDILEKLIILKVLNCNLQDPIGCTLLMCAASQGKLDIVNKLITVGAHLDTQDDNGLTALFYAAKNGHWDIVEWLTKLGADLTPQDDLGQTLPMYAANAGKLDLIKHLVESLENPFFCFVREKR